MTTARRARRTPPATESRSLPAPATPGADIPGRLIAFEGLEGSGISTQMRLVHQWLAGMRCRVFVSTWATSELVRDATRRGRKQQLFTPMTMSLLQATDFSDRYDRQILPMLKAGFVVLCDRYIYTSLARDTVRGCDPEWVRALYGFALEPHLTLFLDLPIHVALDRKFESRQNIDWFEAGMDLNLSADIHESYRLFQGRVHEQYLGLSARHHFMLVDACLPIHEQQRFMRETISDRIDPAAYVDRRNR